MNDQRERCAAMLEGPIGKGTRAAPTWRRRCRNLAMPGKRYCRTHIARQIREDGRL